MVHHFGRYRRYLYTQSGKKYFQKKESPNNFDDKGGGTHSNVGKLKHNKGWQHWYYFENQNRTIMAFSTYCFRYLENRNESWQNNFDSYNTNNFSYKYQRRFNWLQTDPHLLSQTMDGLLRCGPRYVEYIFIFNIHIYIQYIRVGTIVSTKTKNDEHARLSLTRPYVIYNKQIYDFYIAFKWTEKSKIKVYNKQF